MNRAEHKRRATARNQQRQAQHAAARGEKDVAALKPAPEPTPLVRDGLAWLITKGKLSERRQRAAMAYRQAFRDAMADVALRSCLDQTVSAGFGPRAGPATTILGNADAQRLLFRFRWVTIGFMEDVEDARIALDGVCGAGRTIRELAGGDKPRSDALLKTLQTALDAIAQQVDPKPVERAA